jgi:hypothetical protein
MGNAKKQEHMDSAKIIHNPIKNKGPVYILLIDNIHRPFNGVFTP